jgi:RNA polymerase sigma-70 factor (ECF subfamily)
MGMGGTDAAGDFAALMARMRPVLHRYCARMMGSAFDGEDVVQEALARAAQAQLQQDLAHPESWLFRIAHNAALDALRRRRTARLDHAALDALADPSADAAVRVTTLGSFAAFMPLPPAQRAGVILADVLGYSLAEICDILGISLAATKAALHRGRARLRSQGREVVEPAVMDAAERVRLARYADLFNARAFDALRDMLAEDVRLDLVNRARLAGRADVSVYFTRYEAAPPLLARPALAEGRPVLLLSQPDSGALHSVVMLGWRHDRIATIRDFLYAAYVTEGLAFSTA